MSWIASSNSTRTDALYFKVLPPAPALRHWVRYYWILKDDTRSPQIDEYLAPDGFEEIIFSYADGFRREEICGTETQRHILRGSYIVGTKSCGVSCSRIGRLAMIGVKLWPQVLHSFLRSPLHDLSGRPLQLGDVNASVLSELESRLFDADSEPAIKAILDQALLRELSTDFNDMLSFSIRELFESRGTLGIDELIGRCGVHYRTLEKAFRERVGVPPKTLAKILRFKHAFNSLSDKAEAGRLGALECGYYDQSHFCKEFKFFTGRTPTRFFRERLSVDVAKFCLALDLQTLNGSPATAEFVL
jgi:AraC-type DNA-binding domain-containing proteins|nr:helix-turn-helix domain-containing protein [uncultured Steroidobacter sp.]